MFSTQTNIHMMRTRITLALVLTLIVGAIYATSANAAAWPPAGFTEAAATQNSTFPDVQATAVTVYAPLPASFGSHLPECDSVSFLRLKHIGGPVDPSDADKVLTAQPGVLEGASAFYNVGSNLVHRAWVEKGKNIEFWAVDRRANCMEDIGGLLHAKATGDMSKALDYYYGGSTYMGKQFGGFYSKDSADMKWMAKNGLDLTVKDWNQIITRGMPSQTVRKQKMYCGGHSLGGIITGAYADYDFDGNPNTLADAGYNQCAGYFGLDTLVTDDPVKLRQLGPTLGSTSIANGVTSGFDTLVGSGLIAPFVDLPVINPEIMLLLTGIGLAADIDPSGEQTLIHEVPQSSDVKLAMKVLFSRNLSNFVSGTPAADDFRWSNTAMLGGALDDNSMPLSIVQTSMGFFDGGPVAEKNFPLPNVVGSIPGLEWLTNGVLGTGHLAIPTDYGKHCTWVIFCWYTPGTGPIYKWRNYNQLAGVSIPRDSLGNPYTSPAKEVSDVGDVARSLSAAPLNLVEIYFPMKLNIDAFAGLAGATSAVPGQIHAGGVAANPQINIIAGDGPVKSVAAIFSPSSPVIPGYQHLDVLTAAPVQNNGQPEAVTTKLLDFLY